MPTTPQIGEDVTALMGGAPPAVPQVGEDVSHLMPTFSAANEKDAQGNAVVDPNTFGTFASHVGQFINPITAVQSMATAVRHPIDTAQGLTAAQGALFTKAREAYAKGDYQNAAVHLLNFMVPLFGPPIDKAATSLSEGHVAAGLGDAVGIGASIAGPKVFGDAVSASRARLAAAPTDAVVQFAKDRGIPLDAATVSNNLAVKGVQALADRSLGGSAVATPANAARAEAMTRVGGELAAETGAPTTTPELAGTSVRDALTAKVSGHAAAADTAYNKADQLATNADASVDVRMPKQALRPLYNDLKRQSELVPLQGGKARALVALDRLMNGPDKVPLMTAERATGDLGALAGSPDVPELRTAGQGVAAQAFSQLRRQVDTAAAGVSPDLSTALQDGRAATKAKYVTGDVLDLIKDEPVKTMAALTAPKDAAIQRLRTVQQHVPQAIPEVARAYLEDLLQRPQAVADWNKAGSQTKAILFPKAGQAQALDHFFNLTKRISDSNVNPSGSGYMVSLATQGGALGTGLVLTLTNPAVGLPVLAAETGVQIGGATLAKLLRSPVAIRALTRGMTLPASAPAAARAAATANLVRAAQGVGVTLGLPTVAQSPENPGPKP